MRLALPKGRLLLPVQEYLAREGISFTYSSDRDYTPVCSDPELLPKLLKPRAIPQMIALGNFGLGFCGLDIVREAEYGEVVPLADLGLNPVTLVVAVPRGLERILDNPPKRPLLIATEYERIADRWAMGKGIAHITIQTYGSTEAYAPSDADIVFDCQETGRTLAANGLVVIDRIMESSTYLVANRDALADPAKARTIGRIRDIITRRGSHGHRDIDI